jgi:hypothetical protein
MADDNPFVQQSSSPIIDMSAYISEMTKRGGQSWQRGTDQYKWAQDEYARNRALADKIQQRALDTGQTFADAAAADLAESQGYRPARQEQLQYAMQYTTPERMAANRAQALTGAALASDTAKAAAERNLQSIGVDPSAGRYAGLEAGVAQKKALIQAGVGTTSDRQTELMGQQLLDNAIKTGNVLSGQAINEAGVGLAANKEAVDTGLATTASGAATMGTPMQWEQLGFPEMQEWKNAMISQTELQQKENQRNVENALAYKKMQDAQAASSSSGIGALLGAGLGIAGSFIGGPAGGTIGSMLGKAIGSTASGSGSSIASSGGFGTFRRGGMVKRYAEGGTTGGRKFGGRVPARRARFGMTDPYAEDRLDPNEPETPGPGEEEEGGSGMGVPPEGWDEEYGNPPMSHRVPEGTDADEGILYEGVPWQGAPHRNVGEASARRHAEGGRVRRDTSLEEEVNRSVGPPMVPPHLDPMTAPGYRGSGTEAWRRVREASEAAQRADIEERRATSRIRGGPEYEAGRQPSREFFAEGGVVGDSNFDLLDKQMARSRAIAADEDERRVEEDERRAKSKQAFGADYSAAFSGGSAGGATGSGGDVAGGVSGTGGVGGSATGGQGGSAAAGVSGQGVGGDDGGTYVRGGRVYRSGGTVGDILQNTWGVNAFQGGGEIDESEMVDNLGEEQAEGSMVPPEASPSGGQNTDDVHAMLNEGEFVVPKPVASWYGEKFLQNLIQKAYKEMAQPKAEGQPAPAQAVALSPPTFQTARASP